MFVSWHFLLCKQRLFSVMLVLLGHYRANDLRSLGEKVKQSLIADSRII